MIEQLIPAMVEICGPDGVVTDPLDLRTYECAAAKVPFVARGSGTGLSGGALPRTDGVLIVTSRMRRIIAIDPASQRAIVEPGVTNLSVSNAARPFGYFYAPDPSSQVVCSVGGN